MNTQDPWDNIQINMDAIVDRYNDPKVVARQEKLQEVERRGISLSHMYRDLSKDVPSRTTRESAWWSAIWSRPSRSTWDGPDWDLENAREAWDKDHQFVQGQNQNRKEREAREAEAQAVKDAEFAAKRAKELEEVTADLRRRYLASPGATAEGFEKALPELLEQRARAAALADEEPIKSPLSARQIWD